MSIRETDTTATGKYANVNGISMYYQLHGSGDPLVLLHGGGSTIHTTFGAILPLLARTCQVIAVELQAHGHTADRDAPESFAQDAADVVALLQQLGIPKADIFGFSNGGQTAMQMALSHPHLVRRLVIASAFYKRDAVPAGFWEGFDHAQLSDMPQVYADEFRKINSDPKALLSMFSKDVERMRTFEGWTDEQISSIEAPALIVLGDQDLPTPEHGVAMHRLLRNSRLAILPGNHGSYMGEIMSRNTSSAMPELFVAIVTEFLVNH